MNSGVTAPNMVEFQFSPDGKVRWWKQIEVQHGSGYYNLEMADGFATSADIPFDELDRSRPIRFRKAKLGGFKVRIDYTWDVMPAIDGGSRVTLQWRRDRC